MNLVKKILISLFALIISLSSFGVSPVLADDAEDDTVITVYNQLYCGNSVYGEAEVVNTYSWDELYELAEMYQTVDYMMGCFNGWTMQYSTKFVTLETFFEANGLDDLLAEEFLSTTKVTIGAADGAWGVRGGQADFFTPAMSLETIRNNFSWYYPDAMAYATTDDAGVDDKQQMVGDISPIYNPVALMLQYGGATLNEGERISDVLAEGRFNEETRSGCPRIGLGTSLADPETGVITTSRGFNSWSNVTLIYIYEEKDHEFGEDGICVDCGTSSDPDDGEDPDEPDPDNPDPDNPDPEVPDTNPRDDNVDHPYVINIFDEATEIKEYTLPTKSEIQIKTNKNEAYEMELQWSSSDDTVASVDNVGNVTIKTYGTATIYVQSTSGEYSGSAVINAEFYDVMPENVSEGVYKTVYWGTEKGLVKGYDKGEYFAPENSITRIEMVTFLYRLAGRPEVNSNTDIKFSDISSVSGGPLKALQWAVANDITRGYSDGTFRPDENCTRAEISVFLYRLAGKPDTIVNDSFTDIAELSNGAKKAVSWAATYGVSRGYDDGTFRPLNECTRAHIVIFMYRMDTKGLVK